MSFKKGLTRRRMLASLGVGTGAFLMSDLGHMPSAMAEGPGAKGPNLVTFYFGGGWDTLLSLDGRNHQNFTDPEGGIQTAYDMVAAEVPDVAAAMAASGGTGIVQPTGSNIQFGPAIGELSKHYQDLCVIRGIDMGTLTHEVGRRYFLTGKVPRGLSASGSALPTVLASQDPFATAVPNLVLGGVETYNEGLDPKASGLKISGYNDMAKVLKALDDTQVPNEAFDNALAKYHAADRCIHKQLDAKGDVNTYRAGWQKARVFMQGTLWEHFNFKKNPDPNSNIGKAYTAFNVNYNNPYGALNGTVGQGIIAAQALAQGVCQVVSLRPCASLDTHFDNWADDQAERQTGGLNIVSQLIDFLKATEDINNPGNSLFDNTIIMGFSEFSRTPKLNVREGRDHHLSNSCFLAGKGIQGNIAIGATNDTQYQAMPVNLETGAVDEVNGTILRPADVHNTLFEMMGLNQELIANQEPEIIGAMKKK